ncbi:hypothetical protein L596_026723 [Steinernema carpocapsae]|uniref:Serpentine receptor class gamma n=1 Tax=Steinernema carpocapsae TaxID=34508 RepID=A0A4U5M267_STECR|nr:hypothetical protein L596_026723 [Steinernema carpocapsae]
MALCLVILGLEQFTDSYLYGIAYYVIPYNSTAVRIQAPLSVLLALNRLKVICELRYPARVHTILAIFVWLLGLVNYIGLLTPWYGINFPPGQFQPRYDLNKPFTKIIKEVTVYFMFGCQILSFLIYVVISVYMVLRKLKFKTHRLSRQEVGLLCFAVTTFVCDASVTLVFAFGTLPNNQYADFGLFLAYFLDMIVLPPVLYLTMNRSVKSKRLHLPAGVPGVHGPDGATGPQGAPGVPGQDAYGGGVGAPGPAGPVGDAGTPGAPGQNGGSGQPGNDETRGRGAPGPCVPSGQAGAAGASGNNGATCQPEAMGAPGPQGPAGNPGASGVDGQPGQAGGP